MSDSETGPLRPRSGRGARLPPGMAGWASPARQLVLVVAGLAALVAGLTIVEVVQIRMHPLDGRLQLSPDHVAQVVDALHGAVEKQVQAAMKDIRARVTDDAIAAAKRELEPHAARLEELQKGQARLAEAKVGGQPNAAAIEGAVQAIVEKLKGEGLDNVVREAVEKLKGQGLEGAAKEAVEKLKREALDNAVKEAAERLKGEALDNAVREAVEKLRGELRERLTKQVRAEVANKMEFAMDDMRKEIKAALSQRNAGGSKAADAGAAGANASDAKAADEPSGDLAMPSSIDKDPRACHIEYHIDYEGEQLGDAATVESIGDCCGACQKNEKCNVWSYCPSKDGCNGSPRGTCWLRHQANLDPLNLKAKRGRDVPTRGGALYAEADRIRALLKDPDLPVVKMDIAVKGEDWGSIRAVLRKKEAPLATENFRAMCTGEFGDVPDWRGGGSGKKYSWAGTPIYRIIKNFIDQAGVHGLDSVYGGNYRDDELGKTLLQHTHKGVLSLANAKTHENSNHFSIMMSPQHHLDGMMTVFGEVFDGLDVVTRVNDLAEKGDANADAGAVIKACTVLRNGGEPAEIVKERYKLGDKDGRQTPKPAGGRRRALAAGA